MNEINDIAAYLLGLLTFQDVSDKIDFTIRLLVWISLTTSTSLLIKKIYLSLLKKELRNKRRIDLLIVKKKQNVTTGFSNGIAFIPSETTHRITLESEDGVCFEINNKEVYDSLTIGNMADCQIEEEYAQVFFLSRPMEFVKYKISDVKLKDRV